MQMKSDKGHGKQERERETYKVTQETQFSTHFAGMWKERGQQGVNRGLTKTHFQ